MATRTNSFLSAFTLVIFSVLIGTVLSQESISAGAGLNLGMHAGLALLVCFSILGSCAIGVNIISKACAKRLGSP